MAESEAQIANIALGRIGVRASIDDLEEDTAEAQACSAVFDHVRDVVLSSFTWPFATKRETLAPLEDVERDGWGYAFTVPSDALHVVGVWPDTRTPTETTRIPFATEMNDAGDGRIILCDVEEPSIIYVAAVTNPLLFSPLFTDALAWALAMELALSLPVKPQLGPSLEVKYQRALAMAKSAALREQQTDIPPESEFIRVRD